MWLANWSRDYPFTWWCATRFRSNPINDLLVILTVGDIQHRSLASAKVQYVRMSVHQTREHSRPVQIDPLSF
jgi:hypothetical protein